MVRRRTSTALLCTLLLVSGLLCFHLVSAHGGIDDGDDDATPPPADGDASSSSDQHDHLRSNKGLIAVKSCCLVILLVVTFVAGVSPYLYRWNEAFLLLGTQFAAGIFLGTALMHFLADSTSTFHGLTKNRYPFSYMLACVGFLLTMLADCAVAAVTTRNNNNHTRGQIRAVVNNNNNVDAQHQQEEAGRHHHQTTQSSKEEEEEEHQHPIPTMVAVRTASLEDAVLLVFALCFHSVFEGIAIGVSATKSDAWRNLWTIGLHKVFAAVAMGIALLRMVPKRPLLTTAAYALAFGVSSPVGVGIGIAIDAAAEGRAADWTFAVAMGFATGVFLYVAINHLVAKGYRPQEPTRVDGPTFRFLAVLLGVAVMAVVMIWG